MSSTSSHHHQMDHVPQLSLREKLRFPHDNQLHTPILDPPPLFYNPHQQQNPNSTFIYNQFPHQTNNTSFGLSLSSAPLPHHQLKSRTVPLGPFTGYAAVLSRSRFLEPSVKLLEQVCDVSQIAVVGRVLSVDEMLLNGDLSSEIFVGELYFGDDGGLVDSEQKRRRAKLISILDEVCRRYMQYYQQVQAIITSFNSVAGLSMAAPYASHTLKAMYNQFNSIKDIIVSHLQQSNKLLGKGGLFCEDNSRLGLLNSSGSFHRLKGNTGTFGHPQIWRPQRGLPESAVSVLRAWLFEHFLHPYPTDTDKQMLAKQTGLTRNQVSNWFINARVRLWKPMVEEVHNLDMQQKNKDIPRMEDKKTDEQAQLLSSSKTNSTSYQQLEISREHKRHCSATRQVEELNCMQNNIEEAVNFEYDEFTSHHLKNNGIGVSGATTGGLGSVSLTLGLQQDNGICFSEQIPLNVTRRFGLEDCNEAYMLSNFGGQERQFEKDVGSRLLHDFVG